MNRGYYHTFQQIINTILTICGVLLFIGLVVLLTTYQFNIYKKKHGEKMTFTDFLFDSERK